MRRPVRLTSMTAATRSRLWGNGRAWSIALRQFALVFLGTIVRWNARPADRIREQQPVRSQLADGHKPATGLLDRVDSVPPRV